jgi:hypothetical protein
MNVRAFVSPYLEPYGPSFWKKIMFFVYKFIFIQKAIKIQSLKKGFFAIIHSKLNQIAE